jgi:hypothetical protein
LLSYFINYCDYGLEQYLLKPKTTEEYFRRNCVPDNQGGFKAKDKLDTKRSLQYYIDFETLEVHRQIKSYNVPTIVPYTCTLLNHMK